MNRVTLIGRLTRDPDVRYSTSGEKPIAIARYTLAVNRIYKKEGGQNADFIRCIAFGKAGEWAEKYLKQGIKIAIDGRLQTGSYVNNEGTTVYTTDVVVEHQEFCEKKQQQDAPDSADYTATIDGIDPTDAENVFNY